MQSKKILNKISNGLKENKKKKTDDDDFDDDELDHLKDEKEIEHMLEEEMPGELDEEDDEEFINKVEEFKKEHSKAKMISIYELIGKPKFVPLKNIDPKRIKDELKKLILALDKFNIIVHSHGDYEDREKYRFITEEIFKEVVEKDKKHNHITFVYEDYHPEMDEDDEDE